VLREEITVRNHFMELAFAAAILSFSPVTSAQTAHSDRAAKTRAPSTTPDLSGVWFIPEYHRTLLPKEDPPFQPWAEAALKKHDIENNQADPDSGPDPIERCIPPGVPRIMLQPFPWEIVHAKDRVVMIFEYQALTRQIFTDGRGHPKDLEPTYMGHSIGRYEGDTLVVDSVGFNDKTWLDPMGLPHSDALHVVERLRRIDHDSLQVDYTIDDPKAYTKPWTAQRIFKLKPEWQIKEYVCAENNEVK
jgi:hypothetical protein